jgi:hypothetical protein
VNIDPIALHATLAYVIGMAAGWMLAKLVSR